MASSYKYLGTNDRVVSTTELAEEIINSVSGTTFQDKTFFAKSISGSASTNVLDITAGRSSDITSGSADLTKENIIYNQMAKVLLGHDVNNNIKKFSLDANAIDTDNILHNAIFVSLSRNQFKDKVKKGTFDLALEVSGSLRIHLVDKSGSTGPIVRECETGEYGLLYVSGTNNTGLAIATNQSNMTGGLIFYEAGVAVVSPYLWAQSASNSIPTSSNDNFDYNQAGILSSLGYFSGSGGASPKSVGYTFVSGTLSQINTGSFGKILSASYQSITELNSTVYFCRAFNNEFNYSSNPTYLENSQIVVKEGDPMAQPVSYITTVGLYDDNNQLLAVAKLSEPIKKTPDTELIARVRLDF